MRDWMTSSQCTRDSGVEIGVYGRAWTFGDAVGYLALRRHRKEEHQLKQI